MTMNEFNRIARRIEDAYRDPFTEGQINEWFNQFKEEDSQTVNRAVTLLTGLDGYKYFPMTATLWEYIKKAKNAIEAEAETKAKQTVRKDSEWTPEFRDRHQRWMRYLRWILESKEYPKTHKEVARFKANLEKDYPNWQPKMREEKEGVQLAGDVLGDTL